MNKEDINVPLSNIHGQTGTGQMDLAHSAFHAKYTTPFNTSSHASANNFCLLLSVYLKRLFQLFISNQFYKSPCTQAL